MVTLNLPSKWTAWPTAIGQVLADPAVEQPGKLAELMDRKANVSVATRLGDTPPGLAFYLHHRDDILAAANDGDPIKDTLKEVRHKFESGEVSRPLMVGVILLLALDWDTTGQQRVSMNQIYDRIAKACQNRIKGAQERELRRSWEFHRPTAHLWAAYLLFQSEFHEICHSRQRLLLWLAHAEALRRLGAGCHIAHSPKSSQLLDLDATLCLLPSDPLPKVNVQIPSSDAIMRAVARMSEPD